MKRNETVKEGYDPNRLFNHVIAWHSLKNDAHLSRFLTVAPPVICKVRRGRLPMGASLMIRLHEETGLTIREMRTIMQDRRQKHRISNAEWKRKAEQA